MEAVYDALNLKQGDVFFDLGSGVGKLVLYVALRVASFPIGPLISPKLSNQLMT